LVTALGLETGLPSVLVRTDAKDYGTSKQVEGVLQDGDRVVLVEDVVTTGGAGLTAVEVLKAAGAEVISALCVVDREEGGASAVWRSVASVGCSTAGGTLASSAGASATAAGALPGMTSGCPA